VWIFPHAKQADALADDLDDSFYTGDSNNAWLQDSFFADSQAGAATVEVDLYNPTGADLENVQIFAAYSADQLDMVTSVNFSGGDSGDVDYPTDELDESGGTPSLAGGGTMDPHGVYPAYFVSYGVGDLPAGSSGIRTVAIEVVGDFAGGLVVHLDYTAEDADGDPVSGPFEADMNIFENGEDGEPPACDPGALHLSGNLSGGSYKPGEGISFTARLEVVEDFVYERDPVTVTLATGGSSVTSEVGEVSGGNWSWVVPENTPLNLTVNVTATVAPLQLAGDKHTMSASLAWDDCAGGGSDTLSLSAPVTNTPTEASHSAAWWAEQVEKAQKGKKKAAYNSSQLDGMLGAIAAHSDVFVYGSWNGTAPDGASDEGWLDISSLRDAEKVLDGKSPDSRKVRGAERQLLALWLNIASGALNLDTQLEIYEKKHRCRGSHSEFEEHTGRRTLSSSVDTPAEILAFLEGKVDDWKDGSGSAKGDLKYARKLAKAVNLEWLVAA
jgi:hypothetical protein